MEVESRTDPHLREVVWFAVRCRALTLLLQASLLFPSQSCCDIRCLLLPGFSFQCALSWLVLPGWETISSCGEPTDQLHPEGQVAVQ